jgi:hypothetical protein
MSEYELLELMAMAEAHMGTQFSLYLTVISAYMVVAYLVGSNLTTSQVVISSVLMLVAAGGQTWGIFATLGRVGEFLNKKSRDYSADAL